MVDIGGLFELLGILVYVFLVFVIGLSITKSRKGR